MTEDSRKLELNKKSGESLRTLLTKLHARRCSFIYLNVAALPFLALGSHAEKDFKFGDPTQLMGLFKIKNNQILELFNMFLKVFKLDTVKEPYVVDINKLLTYCGKVKWDFSNIDVTIRDNVYSITYKYIEKSEEKIATTVYANPILNYNNYLQLRDWITTNSIVLDSNTPKDLFTYKINTYSEDSRLMAVPYELDDSSETWDVVKFGKLKFLCYPGIELLYGKNLAKFDFEQSLVTTSKKKNKTPELEKDYFCGVLIWSFNNKAFFFGGYFENDDFAYLGCRLYTFLIGYMRPNAQEERA